MPAPIAGLQDTLGRHRETIPFRPSRQRRTSVESRPALTETKLVPIGDDTFAWMLAGTAEAQQGLALPPGGVHEAAILEQLRRMAARLRAKGYAGMWAVVAGGEIVGLCSYNDAPQANGDVEIGYGVAESRRRRGHASAAVALLLEEASRDPRIRAVVAATGLDNVASQRVLERNAFVRVGRRTDSQDGELILWRRATP